HGAILVRRHYRRCRVHACCPPADCLPLRSARSKGEVELQRDVVHVLDPRDGRNPGCACWIAARHESSRCRNHRLGNFYRYSYDDFDPGPHYEVARRAPEALGRRQENSTCKEKLVPIETAGRCRWLPTSDFQIRTLSPSHRVTPTWCRPPGRTD